MRVYPKGPESVIKVKDDYFWKGQAIGECGWPPDLCWRSCGGSGIGSGGG